MDQRTHETHDTYVVSKPGYWPMILIAAVLGLLAWVLLNQYNPVNGYLWQGSVPKMVHEGKEGQPESHSGGEEHGSSGSMQEPQHGGEMSHGSAATGKLDTLTGNFIYETGTVQTINVLDTVAISVGTNSTEYKLIQFLKSNAPVDTVDKTQGWITLDRFYFETGKSAITKESQAQLKNIATIMKAYPDAVLKIGGYTDNSGNPQANMLLSTSRANAAKNALVKLGVPASSLQAEGYGPEHNVADNTTPEGKARNRRVDVRVVKK